MFVVFFFHIDIFSLVVGVIGVFIIGVISGRGTGSSGGRGGDSGGSGAAMAWKWNYVIYDFFLYFWKRRNGWTYGRMDLDRWTNWQVDRRTDMGFHDENKM